MKKKIFFLIGILLILINAPILNNFILYHTDNNTFKYSNLNGTFTCIDRFGFKDPGLTDLAFDLFVKETNQDKKDSELYRLYKINPLCFWRWNYYLTKSSKLRVLRNIKIGKLKGEDTNSFNSNKSRKSSSNDEL